MDKPSDYGSDIRGSNPLRGTKSISNVQFLMYNSLKNTLSNLISNNNINLLYFC